MRVAVGDHQVSNYTAEVLARTSGAKRYSPTLVPDRQWQLNYEAIPEVSTFPAGPGESFFVYYDGGPPAFIGTNDPGAATPPFENVPPRPEWGFGEDPHGLPRRAPDAIEHSRTFLDDGTIGACAAPSGYCFSNGWDGSGRPAVGDRDSRVMETGPSGPVFFAESVGTSRGGYPDRQAYPYPLRLLRNEKTGPLRPVLSHLPSLLKIPRHRRFGVLPLSLPLRETVRTEPLCDGDHIIHNPDRSCETVRPARRNRGRLSRPRSAAWYAS